MSPVRASFVVMTNAKAGAEAAFDDWYDGVHLAEVCAVPGVVGARRFRIEAVTGATADHRSVAIYDIVADDPALTVAEINRRYDGGEMVRSDALADDIVTFLGVDRSDRP